MQFAYLIYSYLDFSFLFFLFLYEMLFFKFGVYISVTNRRANIFHAPVERNSMTILWPRNNDLITLRDTVSFDFAMSLRSHLFFERDTANLAQEISMQNL